MQKIIFATGNKGKLKEVRHLFTGANIELLSLSDFDNIPEVTEDEETFEGNARKKAIEVYNATGIACIADDSGLSADQLGGRPGVYSARYAGDGADDEKNNRKLLEELSGFEEPHNACYKCSAVYYDGNEYISAYGELKGKITFAARGSNGFGYDPIFIPEGYNITAAEMELADKNKISHRAKAFTELKNMIIKKTEKK